MSKTRGPHTRAQCTMMLITRTPYEGPCCLLGLWDVCIPLKQRLPQVLVVKVLHAQRTPGAGAEGLAASLWVGSVATKDAKSQCHIHVYMYMRESIYTYMYIYTYVHILFNTCVYVYTLSVYLSIYLSIYPTIYAPIYFPSQGPILRQ